MTASTINFSNTTPAAGAGKANVAWQNDGGTSTVNISAEVEAPPFAEVVTFAGTSGTLSHTPVGPVWLYRNGVFMSTLTGTPAILKYALAGGAGPGITLSVAAGGSDVFIALYQF